MHLSNPELKVLLNEYEQKRMREERDNDEKIETFLHQNPALAEIIEKINLTSIDLSKSILAGNQEKVVTSQKKLEEYKQKKLEIINKLGITEDFFVPNYECKKCHDTGYLVENNSIMCTCLRQKLLDIKYNQSNIFNISRENFSTFKDTVYSDVVDEKKYHSKVSPRENINNIKSIAMHFVEHFDDAEEKNLLFTGNTGLGKTFLSNCIANEMLKQGKTVLYQTAPVMLDTIIDYRFGKATDDFVYKNILDADLLIIDDLGTESMNSLKFTELFNIINTRLLNQNHKITKTIISTNLSLNNLFNTYDERIFSRLAGYYNICRFFGEDLRLQKSKK